MQELHHCFTGTTAVASCLCLPKIELLDFLTLSTRGDNLSLSVSKMLFTLWPSTPTIYNISVPDTPFKFTPLWSLSLEVMWKGFIAHFSLAWPLTKGMQFLCITNTCDLLAAPGGVERSKQKTEKVSKAGGNVQIYMLFFSVKFSDSSLSHTCTSSLTSINFSKAVMM